MKLFQFFCIFPYLLYIYLNLGNNVEEEKGEIVEIYLFIYFT